MKAAVVLSAGVSPQFGIFDDPVPEQGENLVSVAAAALSQLSRARASGAHYSSAGTFPFVPGVDGVGRLPDGHRVYFALPRKPFGSMAEQVPVLSASCTPVPDALDDVTAAAIANPGMSSWAALTRRAPLAPGQTVLINGATGAAGRLAIQIAKHLGAGKVIVTGRNRQSIQDLPSLGADVTIPLDSSPEEQLRAFRQELQTGEPSIILDYLWGPSAELIIQSIAGKGSGRQEPRIRFVQIGSLAGKTIPLSAEVLRSSGLEIVGTGLGSLSNAQLIATIGELLEAVLPAGLKVETEAVPLAGIEAAWSKDTAGRRLVFTV